MVHELEHVLTRQETSPTIITPLLPPSIKPSPVSSEHHLLSVLVYSPMPNNRVSGRTLMVAGAVVVVVALAPVVTPALLSIGGVSAGTGKLPLS